MTYPNAPIREAVFDIRIEELQNKSLEDFKHFQDILKGKYDNQRVVNSYEGTFTLDSRTIDSSHFFQGIVLVNENKNKQVQFRINGFTLNYLYPYSNWNEFRDEAFSLYELFTNTFSDIKVERIALRYINRISIPLPFEDFEQFVVSTPPVPQNMSKMYKSFFSQVEIPCEDPDYTAVITSTIETKTKDIVPYILDIDVYKEVTGKFEFDDFEYLRKIKNKIFESSITDKTRKLFNK